MKNFSLILGLLTLGSVFAETSVEVYSKDEALYDSNMSKPRLYISNTGTNTISDFSVVYKFTTENGKTPVVEDFYTPLSSVSLENYGNGDFAVIYDYSGVDLYPGDVVPYKDGNVIGIHYSDWSVFDKNNDFANNQSSSFLLNEKIEVYDSNDNLISATYVQPSANPVQDKIELAVYSKDEALSEFNMSKPRIYIENLGTTDLKDFKVVYKFTTEEGKYPQVDDYYTPQSSISISSLGEDDYEITYDYTGHTLKAGEVIPNLSGSVLGIHYSDWSVLSKENDYANNLSTSFVKNNNIQVYNHLGEIIYGGETNQADFNLMATMNKNNGSVTITSEYVNPHTLKVSKLSDRSEIINVKGESLVSVSGGNFVDGEEYIVELIDDGAVISSYDFIYTNPNPYNLRIEYNPSYLKIDHAIPNQVISNLTIVDEEGNVAFNLTLVSRVIYINSLLFNQGHIYTVKLSIDDAVVGIEYFSF